MKQFFFSLFLAVGFIATAQIEAPQPSPSAMVKQTVGLTDVTLEYARPAMRGRAIFGELVPFDKLWRTGANANSTIEFSDDVMVAGTKVKAGKYAVYTKPGKKEWQVMLYADTSNWGTPREWDASKVVATATVPVQSLKMAQESWTMAIGELAMDKAHLQMMWDKTLVQVPFTVPTGDKTQASIDKVMAGPGANDYYQAAAFYLEAGKDMKQAHDWISKAVELRPEAFWMFTRKALIEEKMGDAKAAVNTAKTALAIAQKAGNADYIKINTDNLKRWGAM